MTHLIITLVENQGGIAVQKEAAGAEKRIKKAGTDYSVTFALCRSFIHLLEAFYGQTPDR